MTTEIEKSKALLQNVQRIAKHQEEIKRLRGENFNIFSVLKMESRENDTHSAFLGELLNPKGSHLQGSLFLKLFLKSIDFKGELDTDSAELILEKHIGFKNDDAITGGRIDIYLVDKVNNSICIENKIYAVDQPNQITRYINHNKDKNTVYYLTLKGLPVPEEKNNIVDGIDYFCLSYKLSIIQWLESCLKEAVDQPLLRESIKQYILLIKKLTDQLTDSTMAQEITDLIINNYESAKLISEKVPDIEVKAAHEFLLEAKQQLESELKDGWIISVADDLNKPWSGLEIKHDTWSEGILIKLEGYSKIPWGKNYYGITAHENYFDRSVVNAKLRSLTLINQGEKPTVGWPWFAYIFSLASTEDRSRLFNIEKRKRLLTEVSSSLIALAKECQTLLSEIKPKL